jgi:hypothetical protein
MRRCDDATTHDVCSATDANRLAAISKLLYPVFLSISITRLSTSEELCRNRCCCAWFDLAKIEVVEVRVSELRGRRRADRDERRTEDEDDPGLVLKQRIEESIRRRGQGVCGVREQKSRNETKRNETTIQWYHFGE